MGWGNVAIFPLIIIQSGAPNTGFFVYSGTPALGNPPQFAVVAPGVTADPFGNAITSSLILIQGNIITETGGIFRTAATAPLIQLDGPHDAIFVYDASSNLIATAAPAAGNDGLGDAFLGGVAGYTISGTRVAATLGGGGGTAQSLRFWTAPGAGGPWTLQFSVGVDTSGNLYLTPASAAGAINIPNGSVPPGIAGFTQLTSINGQLVFVNSQGVRLNVQGAQADTSVISNATASFADITKAWSYPANDAVVGTTYRLNTVGTGTQSNPANGLTIAPDFGGEVTGAACALPAAQFTAAEVFRWRSDFEITCLTTGVTGTFRVTCQVWVSSSTGASPMVSIANADITLDTTVAHTIALGSIWGGVVGAPTMGAIKSVYERVV